MPAHSVFEGFRRLLNLAAEVAKTAAFGEVLKFSALKSSLVHLMTS
jgi:hypothetical protein